MMTKPLAGVSALVADDDVDSAELLEMLLAARGAEVRVAHTGAAALDLLRSFAAEVLLLDISLPDMSGYELLEQIRGIAACAKVPAVAITGHASERDRARAVRAGFAVHVTKPIDTEALIHLVAGLGAPPLPAKPIDTLDELDALLASKGVVDALRVLNARSSYRYTALYRFEDGTLRSLALIDRLDPARTKGEDIPVETSFCWMVQRDRSSFSTNEGKLDPRVAGLPLNGDITTYCGALVRNGDGTPFGTICHFDHVPRSISEAELAVLVRFAPALARIVANDGL